MPQLLCPVLVARRQELDVMTGMLSVGSGGVVAVAGDAGIGKSRLVREVTDCALGSGLVAVAGRGVEARRPLPYRPLSDALISACRRHGLPDDAGLIAYRAALGRLLPEWRRPDVAVASESPLVLAEGVLRVLAALGAEQGVLLTIEDLHWADQETLDVLEYLADHAREEKLAVVLTARPGSSSGTGLIRRLVDRRTAVLVELGPLSSEDVATMARLSLGTSHLPAALSGLLARAEGVPFLVEELLAAAIDAGALARQGDDWAMRSVATGLVPRSFADSVRRRLEGLPPEDRTVLDLGALLDRLDPALLAGALGLAPYDVAEVLRQATEMQLAVAPDGLFRFRHALTREAVLAGVHPEARVALARRARAALETVHPGLPEGWCVVAAELSQLAGEDEDAARLLLTAAARALADGALTTASGLLDQSRTLVAPDSAVGQDIEELRARVAGATGDLEAAAASARLVLASCADPGRRFRVHLQLAEAASAAADWALAEKELAAAQPHAADDSALARVDALAAHVLLGGARIAEAEARARRALEITGRSAPAEVTCQALEVLGRIARSRDLGEAAALFAAQQEVAAGHGAMLWELRATHELGTIDLMQVNGTERLRRARELAGEAGALSIAATIDLQLGMSGWVALDAPACLEPARRCQDTARRLNLDLLLAEALLLEAAAHGFAGRRAAMELAISEALATRRPEADLEASGWAHRGTYFLLREDRAGALTALDRAVCLLRDAPVVYVRPYWRTWALLRTVQDDAGDEARAEARLRAQAGSGLGAAIIGYADAIAAGRRGERGRAEALAADAQARVAAPGLAAQRHLAERLVAECALADGWGQPVDWLTEAAAYFRAAGHAHVERACRSLLRRAGAPVGRRAHGAEPPAALAALGVTGREADVLALVAEGLTSKEIAGRLFLSVRTVDKHVERLLAKTGVARRTELRTFRT